jgi:hypothetical protein
MGRRQGQVQAAGERMSLVHVCGVGGTEGCGPEGAVCPWALRVIVGRGRCRQWDASYTCFRVTWPQARETPGD